MAENQQTDMQEKKSAAVEVTVVKEQEVDES